MFYPYFGNTHVILQWHESFADGELCLKAFDLLFFSNSRVFWDFSWVASWWSGHSWPDIEALQTAEIAWGCKLHSPKNGLQNVSCQVTGHGLKMTLFAPHLRSDRSGFSLQQGPCHLRIVLFRRPGRNPTWYSDPVVLCNHGFFWVVWGHFSQRFLQSFGKPDLKSINQRWQVDIACQVDPSQWHSSTCRGCGGGFPRGSTHRWANSTDSPRRCLNGAGTRRIVDLYLGVLIALRFRGDVDVSRHTEVLWVDEGTTEMVFFFLMFFPGWVGDGYAGGAVRAPTCTDCSFDASQLEDSW